jgi:hypothetical protein
LIFGLGELEELRNMWAHQSRWHSPPSDSSVRACRQAALQLNDESGDPRVEAAALFFAFSQSASLLGDGKSFGVRLARLHAADRGLRWTATSSDVHDLYDKVVESSVDWDEVRTWFCDHLKPMGEAHDQH